ncbi:MAG: glycoside hydrolase, partial [Ectopseudomonas oleovorans]
ELLEEAEVLRRIRLNARRHASHLSWDGIVALFEQHLRSAMQPAHLCVSTELAGRAAETRH